MPLIEINENTVLLPMDFETTGLPDWKNPSEGETQPHIVQIGALLVNGQTRKVLETINVIVKPDGWEIPQETIDVHGITMERAMDEGIPESEAVGLLLNAWRKSTIRFMHGKTFDERIMRIALKRYFSDELAEEFKSSPSLCTMSHARAVMCGNMPQLAEAHKYFTGRDLENAHDALADAQGCLDLFFAMHDLA